MGVKVWDTSSWVLELSLHGHRHEVLHMATNSYSLFTGTCHGSIKVWNLGTWECIHTFKAHRHEVRGMAVSGDFLITCSGEFKLWEMAGFGFECQLAMEGPFDSEF